VSSAERLGRRGNKNTFTLPYIPPLRGAKGVATVKLLSAIKEGKDEDEY